MKLKRKCAYVVHVVYFVLNVKWTNVTETNALRLKWSKVAREWKKTIKDCFFSYTRNGKSISQ